MIKWSYNSLQLGEEETVSLWKGCTRVTNNLYSCSNHQKIHARRLYCLVWNRERIFQYITITSTSVSTFSCNSFNHSWEVRCDPHCPEPLTRYLWSDTEMKNKSRPHRQEMNWSSQYCREVMWSLHHRKEKRWSLHHFQVMRWSPILRQEVNRTLVSREQVL